MTFSEYSEVSLSSLQCSQAGEARISSLQQDGVRQVRGLVEYLRGASRFSPPYCCPIGHVYLRGVESCLLDKACFGLSCYPWHESWSLLRIFEVDNMNLYCTSLHGIHSSCTLQINEGFYWMLLLGSQAHTLPACLSTLIHQSHTDFTFKWKD